MKTIIAGLAGLLLLPTLLAAHELKVLASQLALAQLGKRVTVYLSWGHALPVDDLVDAKALERYELVAPDGKTTPLQKSDLSLQANAVELEAAGTYQAVAVRKPAVLTFVLDAAGKRVMKRGGKSAVKEGKIADSLRSGQFAKAVLVSGTSGEETVKAVGLPLEIVPAQGPAAWRSGKDLRVRVLRDGRPLAGATVQATYVGHHPADAWAATTKTGPDGVAALRPTVPGAWVLKVQHRQPAVGQDYDFESLTSTLALEVRP